MCYQPPGTDICITFKSSLMRGRFIHSLDYLHKPIDLVVGILLLFSTASRMAEWWCRSAQLWELVPSPRGCHFHPRSQPHRLGRECPLAVAWKDSGDPGWTCHPLHLLLRVSLGLPRELTRIGRQHCSCHLSYLCLQHFVVTQLVLQC